jgi:hypothetical protein
VRALEVVVAEVALQVALEASEADVQVAGERRPPAFLEDRAMDGLDGAVCLRATGADQRLPCAELRERVAKRLRAKLAAVVAENALQAQPAAASSLATRRASFEVCSPVGLPRGQLTSSVQAKEEATSIAESCQTAPFVPARRPT